ncbi:putative low-specificity L-threonine aldolase 1 [Desmophyllum pertusum]|uniref:Low-specificity L-threonine aldolase 1 n=1 Tax=Desmophyllum pertusum TaxID=174260 RepID=A0A9W9YXC6_9CNID|nr:putative low-specificity L-threonine aldolase 1 [Desmophyllum pertusum]
MSRHLCLVLRVEWRHYSSGNSTGLFSWISRFLKSPRSINLLHSGKQENLANIQQRQFSSMYTSGVDEDFDKKRSGARVIDLRSDTVTKPSKEMRAAMAAADVGDDVYGDDPTVNALQVKAAELTGNKDAALFVPSGTMGEFGSSDGTTVLVEEMRYLLVTWHTSFCWETGWSCTVGWYTHTDSVRTNLDGTLDLLDVESKVRSTCDAHLPTSRLICLEQTHNATGGRVLSLEYLQKVKQLATKHGLKVHMDGARLFNAVAALGVLLHRSPSMLIQSLSAFQRVLVLR